MHPSLPAALLVFALLPACQGHADGGGAEDTAWTTPGGDPDAGLYALLNEDYVRCGVPSTVYDQFFAPAPSYARIRGRDDINDGLPYYMTGAVAESGVEIVTTNCLFCHATYFQGEIQIGLGNPWLDFTVDPSAYAELVPALTTTEAEAAEAQKWSDRVVATGPAVVTDTVGANPADNLAQALFAHRDRETLAWSDSATLAMPGSPAPTDVPPLWNLRKKSASLYTASGQGNLARIMMTASALCTDDTDEAEEIYSYFPDIHAYFADLTAPVFPNATDPALVSQGEALFTQACASCHGTYGEEWTYDNLVVPTDEVGTDPTVSLSVDGNAELYRDWFNESWYGQDARLAVTGGYVAPPLDGVWATAPYLHNGSVPTLRALLDSTSRPVAYAKTGEYDLDGDVGWTWVALPDGKASDGYDAITVYDTRLPGYAATGHTYGDTLTSAERDAVIEYLKTL